MKTYKTIIEKPRLVINYDQDAESPRTFDTNIGHFFTKENRYKSPDGNTHELYQIMLDTEHLADNTNHHIELIKAEAHNAFKQSEPKDGNSHNEDLHIIDIFPIYRHEHSGITYKRGTAGGLDYSNCGFYIVTAQSISGMTLTDEDITKSIDQELEIYTQWVNGEVYHFTLHNENGDVEDSCGNFYNINDIKEYLPEEWKNEDLEKYIQ